MMMASVSGAFLRIEVNSSRTAHRPLVLPPFRLQEKQLTQPLKVCGYRSVFSVSAPADAAPSSAFPTNVAVFHCLRGLPLIPNTLMS